MLKLKMRSSKGCFIMVMGSKGFTDVLWMEGKGT